MGAFSHDLCVTLNAPNLVLEPRTVAHADELFPLLCDPALYKFIPQDPPASLAWLRERYAKAESRLSPDGTEAWLNWLVRLSDGKAAGTTQATCSLDGSVLIAYEISPQFQRRGIATTAVGTMLAHLRNVGLRTARALVDTRNNASIALLERLQFRRVRFIKDADRFKGAPSDEFEYERNLTEMS